MYNLQRITWYSILCEDKHGKWRTTHLNFLNNNQSENICCHHDQTIKPSDDIKTYEYITGFYREFIERLVFNSNSLLITESMFSIVILTRDHSSLQILKRDCC